MMNYESRTIRFFAFLLIILASLFLTTSAKAEDFTSASYTVSNPVLFPGSYSSSDSFRLFSVIAQPSVSSGSSGSFQVNGGFLYYPEPSSAAGAQSAATAEATITGGGPILDIFKKFLTSVKKIVSPYSHGDFNGDGRVNLYDVSILFYRWDKSVEQPGISGTLGNLAALTRSSPDLNKDGIVNIYDLSILLTFWTD